jgi:hypothetical protein
LNLEPPPYLLLMMLPRRAMPLKKIPVSFAVFVLAALIVLPAVHSVNHIAGKTTMIDRTLCADGDPLPPPTPKPLPPGAAS